MRTLKVFFRDIRYNYALNDKLLILLGASVMLPWILTSVIIVGIGFYVFFWGNIRSLIRDVHKSLVPFVFALYLLITSLLHNNLLGAGLSVGMAFIFANLVFYRKYINKNIFEIIINTIIVLSLVSVVYAIGEQFYYMNTVEKMSGFFDIQNRPEHRVHAFFFNATYYAMICVFVTLFCAYQFMVNKEVKLRIFFIIAGATNLFSLFLTGGRIGWLCLAAGILAMLFTNRWYKTLFVYVSLLGGTIVMLACKPGLIPRLAEKGLALGRREHIYQAAILMIKNNYLLGGGPLTYYNIYSNYNHAYALKYGTDHLSKSLGISAPHSHSLFLESILSFGVVGTLIFGYYLIYQFKIYIRLFTKKLDIHLGSLISGILVATMLFCVIDFPVFWIQTGMLFLMIFGSSSIYEDNLD